QLPALVDHLLAAALDLGVLALHRRKGQVLAARSGGHRRGRPADEADQHGGAAEHHQLAARVGLALCDVLFGGVAVALGHHDGRVATPALAVEVQLEGAEVAAQVGAAEFVVEGGAAEGALDHDVEGGDDTLGLAVVDLPGLLEPRYAQVGYAEPGEARLGLGAAPHGTLIADLAAGAGARPGEGGDGG